MLQTIRTTNESNLLNPLSTWNRISSVCFRKFYKCII